MKNKIKMKIIKNQVAFQLTWSDHFLLFKENILFFFHNIQQIFVSKDRISVLSSILIIRNIERCRFTVTRYIE